MFSGIITALVTPMKSNGDIDYACLEKLVERQIAAGVHALVVNGTTGEAPTLTHDEFKKTIETVIKKAAKRVPVIAGTGSNSTQKTIENTKDAMALGADACLIIVPYYNKPTQEGIYQHFKAIAESVPLPLILYNNPARTVTDMSPDTIERLSKIANIVGLKESNMDPKRVKELVSRVGHILDLLTGNDEDGLMALQAGFKGIISVESNVIPKTMRELCEVKTSALNEKLLNFHEKMFIESNPIPCKWILHDMGLIPDGIRLPLTTLSEKYHQEVRAALKEVREEK